MLEWFETVAGPAFAPALMWTVLALLALVAVLIAIKVFRSLTFGTFIAGGRARRARLAVLDATAVDSQRRLVLVRRDDVEHLILIGGSTDIVVERAISVDNAEERAEPVAPAPQRPSVAPRQPSPAPHAEPAISPTMPPPAVPVAAPSVAAEHRPTPPGPQRREEPVIAATSSRPAVAPAASHQRPTEPAQSRPEPQFRPAAPVPPSSPTAPATRPAAPPPVAATSAAAAPTSATASSDSTIDDALLEELELTLEGEARTASHGTGAATRPDPDLDDEMDRLLGELSGDKR